MTLSDLQKDQIINPIDRHFAELLQRIDPNIDQLTLLSAALTSHAISEGHSCLNLHAYADTSLADSKGNTLLKFPNITDWRDTLIASTLVSEDSATQPLVLDKKNRLYLARYWRYEQTIAQQLSEQFLSATPRPLNNNHDAIAQLFNSENDDINWQAVAAISALKYPFSIISGGPGTGKTYTIVRILALLLQQATTPLKIKLAAPTGKAAARLKSSIMQQVTELPSPVADSLNQIYTIHRLLGYQHNSIHFRHHANNPLDVDVLIIDEFSMVDSALFAKLLLALPSHCQLILVGDKDQLSSVEAGSVLNELTHHAPHFSQDFIHHVQQYTRKRLTNTLTDAYPFQDTFIQLQKSHRFADEGGIALLADACHQGNPKLALTLLKQRADLHIFDHTEQLIAQAIDKYKHYLSLIQQGANQTDIFDAFDQYRLLSALRKGQQGAEQLNQQIERTLAQQGLINPSHHWYLGKPILIKTNDYAQNLFNGDLGITLRNQAGELIVAFMQEDGTTKEILPHRLNHYETAYIMTVHKSQGSEFAQVGLILPEQYSPLLSRELIYTAITRAKQRFSLSDPQSLFTRCISQKKQRDAGLYDHILQLHNNNLT